MTLHIKGSDLEEEFAWYCKAFKLPKNEREYRFHPLRRWRFDFAWPKKKVAVELEGGIWIRGGHTRGKGFLKDCEKYNTATFMGWKIIRLTPELVNPENIEAIKKLL